MRARTRFHATALAAAALAVAVASCARNPVTGKRQLALVSEEDEIRLGQQAREQVLAELPPYPDAELQAYVSRLGMEIAAASQRPELPWSFTVVDDPAVNAFALPGGPIFVTRGLLAHMNSEAELVSVLGHEVGHVAARHSVSQLSKAQLAQLGLGVGAIVSEDVARFGQVAAAGLQLLLLRHGRDAERQSDALGFDYMVKLGYDPRPMAEVFETLGLASAQAGGSRLPGWLSTHPDPEDRQEKAAERASKVASAASLRVNAPEYLARVKGLVYGADPRQGYFRGQTFVHPALGFQLEIPAGWAAQNAPGAVVALSPGKDAILTLSSAGKLSPEEAAARFASMEGVKAGAPVRAELNGLPAAATPFEAATEQGAVRGTATFVSHGGATLALVGYGPAGAPRASDEALRGAVASFGPLRDPGARAVEPARIEIVTVPREMGPEELSRAFPSTVDARALAVLNGLAEGERLAAGALAKRVVGGTPAETVLAPGRAAESGTAGGGR
jgi:predicted Zn-dependent protease